MDLAEYSKMHKFEEEYWWFKGRRDLILESVRILVEDLPAGRILDVGCGTGLNLKILSKYGHAYGLDFSNEALRFSRSRGDLPLIKASADKLPFKNDAFDIICALDVLEHIDDDKSAMLEINRVLKSGAPFVLTVPAFEFLWSIHDEANHHKRRYEKSLLIQSLRSSGFTIEKITYWNFFLFPFIAVARLFRKLGRQEKTSDIAKLPWVMNYLMLRILKVENFMIGKNLNLPAGVSLLCICRKK